MTIYEVARLILFLVGYSTVFLSVLPLIPSDYWYIRVLDYPRSQKFWINAVVLILFLFLFRADNTHDIVFIGVLTLNQGYLFSLIWEYTPLASYQMKNNPDTNAATIKVLIANVLQDNTNSQLCVNTIKRYDPDIFLLVETDERWCEAVQACAGAYPFRVLKPQSNTYGMALFSKLEITKHAVRFLVEPDVPSITAEIKTKAGEVFRLYCLHPKPPIPGEAQKSTERDAEILLIAKEAKASGLPVIVAGDLNDVAWSYTTKLFLKVSSLIDPRIGRGFYSTYHADHKLLRWSLDHVFCSSHFYLQDLKRLPHIGSDHFPIFIEVCLKPVEIKANKQEEKEADEDDFELAAKKIEAGL